ncbi:MAG: hypothetical protein AB7G11_12590 [Phycisphaerales bacterium]
MGEQIKTVLLVTLIAALIWIWAEGESFQTETVNSRIAFVTDSPDLSVTPGEGWNGAVRVQLEGSNSAIRQAAEAISNSIVLSPVNTDALATPGVRKVVQLGGAIKKLAALRELGVTVVDVEPAEVVVTVTKYVQRELLVRPEFPTEIDLLGEATVTPARVSVRMPEQTASSLTESDVIRLTLSPRDLQVTREDGLQTVTLPLSLPDKLRGVPGVDPDPDQATVSFRVRKNVDTVTLASVPVWVSVPPTESSGWDIEVKTEFLRDVVFTGPKDQIRALRENKLVPIAEVRLSSDELEAGITSKEAVIVDVPSQVTASAPTRLVELVIKKRTGSGPSDAGGESRGVGGGGGGGILPGTPAPPVPPADAEHPGAAAETEGN